jgi:CBS domain containing-hemolysin-like protein
MSPGSLITILLLITLNAFFVGVEFAAVTSRRARLDLLVGEKETRAARLVRKWLDQPAARDRLIAASQLGITVVSLALGAVGENAFTAWLSPYFEAQQFPPFLSFLQIFIPFLPIIIALTIITSVHVVFGEQVPKVATLHSPERFALFAAVPMEIFSNLFKGFVDILDWATHAVLDLAGVEASSDHISLVSVEELKQMVSGPETEGVIEQPERDMLNAVIDFGEMVVRQVAIPRTEIIAVPVSASLNEVIEIVSDHVITKLPVYEESLDHITGIIHLRDVIRVMRRGQLDHQTAEDVMREALFVPENISVNDLMHQFRSSRTHIAIVLDEFGGTAGLVTLHDLLAEIIGEVRDNFDSTRPQIQTQPDGSALINGMTTIEEVNGHFDLKLTEPNYDTIAGFVLGRLGHIPREGEMVVDRSNHVLLKVTSMDRQRVDRVMLKRIPA